MRLAGSPFPGSSPGSIGGLRDRSGMVAELYESDIRPSELEQRVRSMQRRDIESQFLDSTGGGLRPERVVHVGCLCGGQAQCQASFTKLGFDFVSCSGCGLLFVDPRPTPEALSTFYQTSESERLKLEILERTRAVRQERLFRPRVEWVTSLLRSRGGRLLD